MTNQVAETTISAGIAKQMADTGERFIEELYDTYSEPLFRYALTLTCSSEDAEDAVQVVFIRVAREWKRAARVGNIKAYLFSSVRNAAFNVLRSKRRREALNESMCTAFKVDMQTVHDEAPVGSRALCEALDKLPVDQREVLVLKIFDEMTFQEIADTVGTSVNTVASRYRYAITKLREVLEVSDNEG